VPGPGGADNDSDDDMPPLDYVGANPQEERKTAKQEAAEDDDDMPPLDYVGTCASPTSPTLAGLKEGDKVTLNGLSKAELNGQRGTISSVPPGVHERLPVKLESTGKLMSIKPANLVKFTAAAADDDDDEDDMPPLDYVGTAPKQSGQPKKQQVEDDDDDDMPPLDYVGAAPKKVEQPKKPQDDDDDDDDMPPLDYVGTAPKKVEQPKKPQDDDDDDDDMPPLDYVGVAPKQVEQPEKPQPDGDDDEDDMPPLEYVGNADSVAFNFKEGDRVVLTGLSTADLNGQQGTIERFLKTAKGRLPVRLDSSGKKLSIRPENLGKVAAAPAAVETAVAEDSEDSMPPLDHTGVGSPTSPVRDGEESGDSMPPLEPEIASPSSAGMASPGSKKGKSGSANGKPVQEEPRDLVPGDLVVLQKLKLTNLNGEYAKVTKASTTDSRIQVKLMRSGKRLLVKWANAERAPAQEPAESDDSMPPLDNAATPSRKPAVWKGASAEALLEQMKSAMQSNSQAEVAEVLAEVESAQDLDWGEHRERKKQLLKKLRAKRRKMQQSASGDGKSGVSAGEGPAERRQAPAAMPARQPAQGGSSDRSSQSEKDWVVLGAGSDKGSVSCTSGAAASRDKTVVQEGLSLVQQWCNELQLPPHLVQLLAEEEVTDPQELTSIGDEELAGLTKGLKIGPKGRFLKAVQRMRAVEQAELGSSC